MKTLKMFSVFLVATVFIIGCDMDEDEEKEVTIFRPVDGTVVYRECSISINTNYDVDSVEYSIRQVDPPGGTVTAPSDSVPRFPYQWDTTVHPDSSYHEIFAKAFYPDEEVLSDTVTVMVDNTVCVRFIVYPGSSIQEMINSDDVLDGDTVFVKAGTYNEAINFNGKKIVLKGEGYGVTILDGTGLDADVVTFNHGEDTTAVIQGFTIKIVDALTYTGIYCVQAHPLIQGNYLENSYAGIELSSADPIIRNNHIKDHTYAGILSDGSNPVVESNQILNNSKMGIKITGANTTPIIKNNTISNNPEYGIHCRYSNPVIQGNIFEYDSLGIYLRDSNPEEVHLNTFRVNVVGIWCKESSPPSIQQNSFQNNLLGIAILDSDLEEVKLNTFEGNMLGIGCDGSSLTIKQNFFTGNGGGIILSGPSSPDPEIYNNLIVNSVTISTEDLSFIADALDILIDNLPNVEGGIGIGIYSSHPSIVNNTIADGSGMGIGTFQSSNTEVKNTILWGNTLDEIWSVPLIEVSYSDVQEGTGEPWFTSTCIDTLPHFVGGGDYHLQDGSPCKGTGQDGVDMGAYGGPGGDWEISP
ncbi:right-handed parallel beta-helix repeat-containing protein [candidate division KSB1 bacterium]|nr:right-handed parallel beta-helix repeat-containing protein [candidate division KSB1 bacterium]